MTEEEMITEETTEDKDLKVDQDLKELKTKEINNSSVQGRRKNTHVNAKKSKAS